VVGAPVIRQYTDAFAAVSPHDGMLDALILPQANRQRMSLFLQEVARRHPEEFVLMVLDGAGGHRATHFVILPQLHLIDLPLYRPELNPAEHLWDEIREKWFPNRLFHDVSTVEDVLEDALRTLEKDPARVFGLAGFEWVVNRPLNAI